MLPNSRLLLLMLGLLGASATLLAAERGNRAASVTPIPSLDVPRYMGTWYEIAKYPNRFQKQCDGYTTAHYTLEPDKTVQVINRCRRADGTQDEAVATARQVGGPTAPTLKVRFAPAWLSFLPMVWGDYWVIDLDPDYQLAAVSEPGRDYLWILSRTPTLDAAVRDRLLQTAKGYGFATDKLIWVQQSADQ